MSGDPGSVASRGAAGAGTSRPLAPGLRWVFVDVGGPIVSDRRLYETYYQVLRELAAPDLTPEVFWSTYEALCQQQAGRMADGLLARLCPPQLRPSVEREARHRWDAIRYQPEDLYPEVPGALERLAGRYRLGILANQPAWIRELLDAWGLGRMFAVWGVSDAVGYSKPDPRLFRWCLEAAACAPQEAAMVGDRLDVDVLPAKSLGMAAVWVLRNEAPPDPPPEQAARADAAVADLEEAARLLVGA